MPHWKKHIGKFKNKHWDLAMMHAQKCEEWIIDQQLSKIEGKSLLLEADFWINYLEALKYWIESQPVRAQSKLAFKEKCSTITEDIGLITNAQQMITVYCSKNAIAEASNQTFIKIVPV